MAKTVRVSGASGFRIIVKHILPNCLAPLLVTLTFIFAFLIVAFNLLADLLYGMLDPRIRYE